MRSRLMNAGIHTTQTHWHAQETRNRRKRQNRPSQTLRRAALFVKLAVIIYENGEILSKYTYFLLLTSDAFGIHAARFLENFSLAMGWSLRGGPFFLAVAQVPKDPPKLGFPGFTVADSFGLKAGCVA